MIHEIKDMEKTISELLPTRDEQGDKQRQSAEQTFIHQFHML